MSEEGNEGFSSEFAEACNASGCAASGANGDVCHLGNRVRCLAIFDFAAFRKEKGQKRVREAVEALLQSAICPAMGKNAMERLTAEPGQLVVGEEEVLILKELTNAESYKGEREWKKSERKKGS